MSFQELTSPFMYSAMAFLLGIGFFAMAVALLPKWIDRMTPHIDETKELVNGNQAVGNYYGLVTAASILGISLIISAAIIAGLHGG